MLEFFCCILYNISNNNLYGEFSLILNCQGRYEYGFFQYIRRYKRNAALPAHYGAYVRIYHACA